MRHELLTQRALCIGVNAKKAMLSQHFVTHVIPPLGCMYLIKGVWFEQACMVDDDDTL